MMTCAASSALRSAGFASARFVPAESVSAESVIDARKPVDLETLAIWAVMVQRADRDDVTLHEVEARADGRGHVRWSTDGVAALERIGALGCRIDGGGARRGVALRIHPDAEAVAAAIERIPDPRRRSLVLLHARQGSGPGWLPREQRLVAVAAADAKRGRYRHVVAGAWEDAPERIDAARAILARGDRIVDLRGRSVIEREESGFDFRRAEDGRRQVHVRWCPVELEPSVAEIRAVNEAYAEWHAGMAWLLSALRSAPLRAHRLTGFKAPAAPWA